MTLRKRASVVVENGVGPRGATSGKTCEKLYPVNVNVLVQILPNLVCMILRTRDFICATIDGLGYTIPPSMEEKVGEIVSNLKNMCTLRQNHVSVLIRPMSPLLIYVLQIKNETKLWPFNDTAKARDAKCG